MGGRSGTFLGAASIVLLAVVLVVAFLGDSRDGDAAAEPIQAVATTSIAPDSTASTSAPTDTSTATSVTPTSAPSATDAPTATSTAPATTAAPTTAAPTTTAPTTTVYEGPPREATLSFTGDIITHSEVTRYARVFAGGSGYDFTPMFELVADELSASDLAICHLESTLSATERPTGYPRFRGPAELAEALAGAGYDGCSTASNHAFDHEMEGLVETLEVLDDAGLGHAGTARDADEADEIAIYDAGGIAVAHLSYTYDINSGDLGDVPFAVNVIDVDQITADADAARAAGAEFVVASLHWGTEYQSTPDANQSAAAEALAEADSVDLVIGHHAHHIQPLTKIDNTWIAYGLGNFLSNQTPGCCGARSEDGVIMTFTIADGPDGVAVESVRYTPTWVDRPQMQVIPVVDHLDTSGLPSWYRAALRNSFNRTTGVVEELDEDQLLDVEPSATL